LIGGHEKAVLSKLPNRDELASYLISRVPDRVYVLRTRTEKKKKMDPVDLPWGNGVQELHVRPYTNPGDSEQKEIRSPVAGLILDEFWIGNDRGAGVKGRGSMLLPCSIRNLVDAGIGQQEIKDGKVVTRNGVRQLQATVITIYAGRILSESMDRLTGPSAIPWLARIFVNDKRYRALCNGIKEDLHVWSVMFEILDPKNLLESLPEPNVESLESYLQEALTRLGVEELGDLDMLGAEDLKPFMFEEYGIAAEERARVLKDYPPIWEHQGANYTVSVESNGRIVCLEPENAKAKKSKGPPAELLPRFRGAVVMYRKASRLVRLR